ncbi:aminotransferase class I/II-fold pyridoxal phosphate-dependent enzyme [Polymorphospora lycopeni]|uniref:Aminotransferase class I/II-fold pyridoxal phosphate-dependent enzyme n=1 Tax=Polymorphospora lycopeni TaxID=3140240 RepID=A0ABV5CST9_9ACTN
MSSPPLPGAHRLGDFSAYRSHEAPRSDATGTEWDLSNNELTLPPLPEVAEAVRICGLDPNRYPAPLPHLLVERLAGQFGVARTQIVVGPGSAGVLQQLLLVLCTERDEVLYAWPAFDAYPLLIAVAGATGVRVPLTATGAHDLSVFLARVTPRTRVVILCTPHNPTGRRISRDELRWFLNELPPQVVTIVDQAYVEFDELDENDDLDLVHQRSKAVLLRTFSKAYGLAGLRVGYALADSEISETARKATLPFAVTRAAEAAAVASLDQETVMKERIAMVRRLRTELGESLGDLGLACPPSHGNFLWLPLGRSATGFGESVARDGIKVRVYPDHGVRISVGSRAAHRRLLAAARVTGHAAD